MAPGVSSSEYAAEKTSRHAHERRNNDSPARIAFVVPSATPGQSGVADYALGLASQLQAWGHGTLVVGLNDPGTDRTDRGEWNEVVVVRLPSFKPWEQRVKEARETLASFEAGWVSLQMVVYGYQPKGLVWRLVPGFATLAGGASSHLMCHELWLGEEQAARLKHRLVGWFQRLGLVRLHRAWRAPLVHTQTTPYLAILRRMGWAAQRLPLFGGIPLSEAPSPGSKNPILADCGLRLEGGQRERVLVLGVFGSVHPEWDPCPMLRHLGAHARAAGRRLAVVGVGRLAAAGRDHWGRLATRSGDLCSWAHAGERPASEISAWLHSLDYGLATTPWGLIEKSSSVAAMVDHGLPVIVTRDDWRPRRAPSAMPADHPLLIRFDSRFEDRLESVRRGEARERRAEVARQWEAETCRARVPGLSSPPIEGG